MATGTTAHARPAIDAELVRRLVDAQFPQWAALPLSLLDPAGSDHAIYRLGEELSVRLPRHAGAIGQAGKELQWLPRLAPHLPLAIRPSFWSLAGAAGTVPRLVEWGEHPAVRRWGRSDLRRVLIGPAAPTPAASMWKWGPVPAGSCRP